MINWSTDEKRFKKERPEEYEFWRLTQLINYGLEAGEKLDKNALVKSWQRIEKRYTHFQTT